MAQEQAQRGADTRGEPCFPYTSCSNICPTSLGLITNPLKALTPQELGGVQVLFVSVDRQRDMLKRLREYRVYFHPSILHVTGTPAQMAAVAQLHGGGMMMMRRIDHIDLPAGKTVVPRPGGLHVMLIGLKRPLVPGASVDLTLIFADGSRQLVEGPVRRIGMPPIGGPHESH